MDQNQTPLLTALKQAAETPGAAFYTPGHRRGQGIPESLAAVFGSQVFRADLPELPELDNLFAPEGVIKQAQELAAAAFGSDLCRFLVNGSTVGIIASILATCDPEDKILLPRNIHKSVISGLVMSGARAIFINPEYDQDWHFPLSLTPKAIAKALEQHPDIKAVMVVYPTYHGICGNLAAIATIVHNHNIPLLVDEAHGGHFHFHQQLPPSALQWGADLTVQSTHKVLGAMNQASMVHIKGDRINLTRLDNALQMLQTTSPSYLLLASLDAARHQIVNHGQKRLTEALKLAQRAKTQLENLPGLRVYHPPLTAGCVALDPTRLTVEVSHCGLSGYEADTILHQQFGVTAELPDLQHLTMIISPANSQADIDQMIKGFAFLSQKALSGASQNPPTQNQHHWQMIDTISPFETAIAEVSAMSVRDAFFAKTISLPTPDCPGQISAECVCPYPPGVPILWPGEAISKKAIAFLQQVKALGGEITGSSDQTLATLRVIDH
ncbi:MULTISPECIES: aminotransferase class I/II-fold pyridoxal phosphate-dependent enzyme [Arthrospira]|uniref:aminotransferase class I/II-fold pyridoxal phosphate-dependent enzyme n=1 Tax=Oscillatoriales TaxID=1150 RepID=UPI0001C381D2|nr:aminotransferase class I/II-fold pyridoxal phosphate-dependent enzyme [Arthrospira platensis]AMW26924.1 lysine decarboxylase [Arthrospira platensis YZ]KDR54586.1 lysine decarboxylase [Arthrospira platensis str. Paraca]MBD2710440.1 aminotransferase class I/II-fold pyridoxal phosphate-dependent enzyme [Arthrospira platensis FACHB-835]MDT9310755.1 aminotransferase class I/II-fold pyridoxal phosphate-dependent enzyme [Limnospira sp. Paracas R14]QQW29673.1 aminotransferase class I/II-fold pyrido